MSFKTNMNEYILALKSEIEQIESVSRVRRFKGNINDDMMQRLKVDLRQEGKCEVFIHVQSAQAEQDFVKRRVYLDNLIQVHIIGFTSADVDDVGWSDDVYDCATDIYELITMKGNVIGNVVTVGQPILGSLTNTYDSVEEGTRTAISTITFTHKIRT